MNVQLDGRLLSDHVAAAAADLAQIRIRFGVVAGAVGGLLQHGFGNAAQVQLVGRGLMVVPLLLGLPGVDAHDQVAFLAKVMDKVLGIGRSIFTAEKHMFILDRAMSAGALHFLQQPLQARAGVFDGEGFFEHVSQSVAEQGHVLALGIVKGDRQDFSAITGLLEERVNFRVLFGINAGRICHCVSGCLCSLTDSFKSRQLLRQQKLAFFYPKRG